ncbi:MAG: hypothetical protein ABSH07_08110 [Candidatus Dormibacteria bacterium]
MTVHLPDVASRKKLDELSQRTGLSFGELVKQGLGVVETNVDGAYQRGWRDAAAAYRLTVLCSVCAQPIEVRARSDIARAAAAALAERGWVHGGTCYAQRFGSPPV